MAAKRPSLAVKNLQILIRSGVSYPGVCSGFYFMLDLFPDAEKTGPEAALNYERMLHSVEAED
jgi:hypothetical protein